jgi:uncharacterized membrane protein
MQGLPTIVSALVSATQQTLQAPPGSPLWMTLGADALLFLHIAGGAVGLVSGAVALMVRKGGRAHRIAGLTFVVSMTCMAAIGAAVSPFLPIPQRANVAAGLLTLYLLASAWLAVRRRDIVPGWPDAAGLTVALTVVGAGALWTVQANQSPTGTLDGSPPQAFYIFMALGGLGAIGDVRLFVTGGLSGRPRLGRHLWRMSAALFIASGSFFLGQQRVMPIWMRGSVWLFVPALAPLAVMVYWLVRIRLAKSTVPPRPGPASDAAVEPVTRRAGI